MNLRCNPNLPQELEDAFLVVDTCSIINAMNAADFRDLLLEIRKSGCSLFSAISVKQEFLRYVTSIRERNEAIKSLDALDIQFIRDIDQKLETDRGIAFQLAFNSYYKNKHGSNKTPSYVDMLLLFMTYYYSHDSMEVYLMTSNHRDVPGFYERDELVVFEESGNIRTEALYKFNKSRFENKIDRIIREGTTNST